MLGQRQTLAGVAIAQRCEETLFADGLKPWLLWSQVVTHTKCWSPIHVAGLGLKVVELAAAHAIHNGFTAPGDITDSWWKSSLERSFNCSWKTVRRKNWINTFVLSTNQYANNSEEMRLETASYEDLLKVGQQASKTIHQMPFEGYIIAQAIVAVNAICSRFGLRWALTNKPRTPYLMVLGFFSIFFFLDPG